MKVRDVMTAHPVLATARDQPKAEYRVPAAALAGLPPGARLLWQVDAVYPDGSRRTSPTFTATVQ